MVNIKPVKTIDTTSTINRSQSSSVHQLSHHKSSMNSIESQWFLGEVSIFPEVSHHFPQFNHHLAMAFPWFLHIFCWLNQVKSHKIPIFWWLNHNFPIVFPLGFLWFRPISPFLSATRCRELVDRGTWDVTAVGRDGSESRGPGGVGWDDQPIFGWLDELSSSREILVVWNHGMDYDCPFSNFRIPTDELHDFSEG